jgi:acid phosphatase
MNRLPRKIGAFLSVIALGVLAGCATVAEPPNLHDQKQALIRYHDTGPYAADLQRVVNEAMAYIRERAKSGAPKLAVVLDIDDTSISTWERLLEHDFGKKDFLFVEWFSKHPGPVIAPMLELYRESQRLGVTIFFVTGRATNLETQTKDNLKALGYTDYAGLYFRPNPDPNKSAVPFKSGARRDIAAKGYTIIANIGDQQSDLDGGFSERTFKLPNPFYFSF